MPSNLTEPYVLAITDSAGKVGTESKVYAYNRTNDEELEATFNASSQALIDLGEFTTEIAQGDVIEIRVTGLYEGITTHTVDLTGPASGGADVSITTTDVSTSITSISL